jgi:hypothetical protein
MCFVSSPPHTPGAPTIHQSIPPFASQMFGNNVRSIRLSIQASTPAHDPVSYRAHPVTVPHPNCGHTFCAICMIKHFFSRFHRTCGGWHEHVECPMCRSILIYTPNQVPRNPLTFPFAKNRMADAAVTALVDQLTEQVEGATIQNRCENVDVSKGSFLFDCENPFSVWRKGGSSRMEWLERREYVSNHPSPHPVSHNIIHSTAYPEGADVCVYALQYIPS